MTRPEWRVQGTKPLMYSHINNHNTGIHTIIVGTNHWQVTQKFRDPSHNFKK